MRGAKRDNELVNDESKMAVAAPLPRPPARRINGWEERFVGQDPKLSEIADLYREIGFEVLIEEYDPEPCEGCCKICFDESPAKFFVVYTRKGSAGSYEDELFG